MRKFHVVFLAAVIMPLIPGLSPRCHAQESDDWFINDSGKTWFVGRHKDHPLDSVHPQFPTLGKIKGLMIRIVNDNEVDDDDEVQYYKADLFAYYTVPASADDGDPVRYTDMQKLASLVGQRNKAGGEKRQTLTLRTSGSDAIVKRINLLAIPRRHNSAERVILCSFKFKNTTAAMAPTAGCDDPPAEDILEEEDFVDMVAPMEEPDIGPEYLEEPPEMPVP